MEQITFSIYRQSAEPNTTIKVNNTEVAVNKCVLALSSSYFQRYFFDDSYPAPENIELPESTTVEDFKRLLAALPPEQRQLDDGCIEAVTILAYRFSMASVVNLCRDFLMARSRKSKLSKFRIAHKHGWPDLEAEILKTMLQDYSGTNFVENAMEFAMLDDNAKAAFTARHAELVSASYRVNLARDYDDWY